MHQRNVHRQLPQLFFACTLGFLTGCVGEIGTSSSSAPNSSENQTSSVSSLSSAGVSSLSSASVSGSTSSAPQSDAFARGKALYESLELTCSLCHEKDGSGGAIMKPLAPGACTLEATDGCNDIPTVARYIAGNMPDKSGRCTDTNGSSCATDIATYIITAFDPANNVSNGDRDGDGVADEDDKCPGTDSGKSVGPTGCAAKDETDLPIVNSITTPQMRLTASQYANTIKTAFGQESLPNITYMSDLFGPFEIFANNANGTAAPGDFSTVLGGAKVLAESIVKGYSAKCNDNNWRSNTEQCVTDHLAPALQMLYREQSLPAADIQSVASVIKANFALNATTEQAIAAGITLALIDDRTIFKLEHGSSPLVSGKQQLTEREFINRLSYFLVGNTPDEALIADVNGIINTPSKIIRQAERLAAQKQHQDVVWKFVAEWLNIQTTVPSETMALVPAPLVGDQCNYTGQCKTKFAGLAQSYDCANSASANSVCMCDGARCDSLSGGAALSLADAAQLETRKFIDYIVDNNLPFSELFNANYSFINKTLAEHYKVPAPAADWELYTFPAGANRQGILTHASFLSSNGNHGRDLNTIFRGKVLYERLFCEKMPIPPNANELFELNDQIADRTVDPICGACHNKVDPIGRIFDLYDDNGGLYESQELFGEVTASADISNTYDSVAELSSAIAGSESVLYCATQQLFRSSLGRDVSRAETESFMQVRNALSGGTLSEAMSALAATDAFKHVYTNFNPDSQCSMGN